MAFRNMIQEILGVAGMNRGLAATRINEALEKIQNENVWSFQLKDGGWLTANMLGGPNTSFLSPGTITVIPFSTQIIGDAVATAAWIAPVPYPPFLTQQQIRSPYYSLYNIIALGNAPAGTIAYLTIFTAGSGQTPGTYTVSGVGGGGSGAQASITVDATGTVTIQPVLVSAGSGYINPDGSPNLPTFTVPGGGVSATFTPVLNAAITIDRPWMEPPQAGGTYLIYQAYYPAPPGWKRWYAIRDTTNNNMMDFWTKTQIDLANDDPQRSIFDQPYYVVPYEIDQRPGSATLGQMLFELWPHPICQFPYSFNCQCNWPKLSGPNDTVPYPLTEELVKERAYEMVYLWKEGQKGDNQERGSGSDNKFLAQAHKTEYNELIKQLRIMDRHIADTYFTKARMSAPFGGEPFATVNGQVNVGGWGG